MARGTQFSVLVSKLRNEIGRSDNAAASVADKNALKQRINSVYEGLYLDFDWPFLRLREKLALQTGERYYDIPSVMDYDRIETVELWADGLRLDVERGIAIEDFTLSDPDAGDRQDPVQKWDIVRTTTKEQVEVWPVPATGTQALWFTGFFKFAPLVNDNDLCLLDDNLVVLTAAASMLARQENKDAPLIAKQAQQLYTRLRGRAQGADRIYRMGLEGDDMPYRHTPIVVRVGG